MIMSVFDSGRRGRVTVRSLWVSRQQFPVPARASLSSLNITSILFILSLCGEINSTESACDNNQFILERWEKFKNLSDQNLRSCSEPWRMCSTFPWRWTNSSTLGITWPGRSVEGSARKKRKSLRRDSQVGTLSRDLEGRTAMNTLYIRRDRPY